MVGGDYLRLRVLLGPNHHMEELGYNFANFREDHMSIYSIPSGLRNHCVIAQDDRIQYSFDDLENARTDDEVWNAAQRELLSSGHIHNYLRMVWGSAY